MTHVSQNGPQLGSQHGFDKTIADTQKIIGDSPAVLALRNMIARVGASDASVLICGPSGSGKELVARALHNASNRQSAPFVALNCGAIPSELVESELFGHERGAFTGALKQRIGRFEQADTGTLFLDEIGDMRCDIQVKLLRVLEDNIITRIGSNTARHVNVRMVSATHQDIDIAITDNRFRADLFFRLGVVILRVPSLAERVEDIPALIAHFQKHVPASNRARFDESAIRHLQAYDWPGNIRELRNFTERAAIMFGNRIISGRDVGMLLGLHPLILPVQAEANIAAYDNGQHFAASHMPGPSAPLYAERPHDEEPINLKNMIETFEQDSICNALSKADGIITEAARLLSLKRTTLTEKMRKYGLEAMC